LRDGVGAKKVFTGLVAARDAIDDEFGHYVIVMNTTGRKDLAIKIASKIDKVKSLANNYLKRFARILFRKSVSEDDMKKFFGMRRSPPNYAPIPQQPKKKPGRFGALKRSLIGLSDDVLVLLTRKGVFKPTLMKFIYNEPPMKEKPPGFTVEGTLQDAIRNLNAAAKTVLNVFQGKEKYHPSMYISLLTELRNARNVLDEFEQQAHSTPEYQKLDTDIAATQLALKRLREMLREQGLEKYMKGKGVKDDEDDWGHVGAILEDAATSLSDTTNYMKDIISGKEKYNKEDMKQFELDIVAASDLLKNNEKASETSEYHKLRVNLLMAGLAYRQLTKHLESRGLEKFMRRDEQSGNERINENTKDLTREIIKSAANIEDFYNNLDAPLSTKKLWIRGIISDIARLSPKIATILRLFSDIKNKPDNPEDLKIVQNFDGWQKQYMTWVLKFRDDYDKGEFNKMTKGSIGRFALNRAVKLVGPASRGTKTAMASVARRSANRGIKPTISRIKGAVKAGFRGNWGRAAKEADIGAGQVLRSHAVRKPIQGAIVGAKKKLGHRGRKLVRGALPWAGAIGGVMGYEHVKGKAKRAIGMGNEEYEGAKKSLTLGDIFKGLTNIESSMKKIYGGKARSKGVTEEQVDPEQLKMGVEVELEHTDNKHKAKQIALDHLAEIKDYYTRLKRMEEDAPKSVKKAMGAKLIRNIARNMKRGIRHPASLEVVSHGASAVAGRDKKKEKKREPYHSMDMHEGAGEDDGW